MAETLQPLSEEAAQRLGGAPRRAPGRRGGRLVRLAPAVTLALFLGPVVVGLIGTWLPAFGILPVLGGTAPSLAPWRSLAAAPGLATAVRLSVTTGFAATILALLLAVGFCAAWQGTRAFEAMRRLLAPALALPHAAFAIGFGFLVAPSGWIARLLSPWATGWVTPPDLALVQDPHGLALTAGLVVKEVPFLLLMIVAALGQTSAGQALCIARTMGYGPVTAWLKGVLPMIYPQIRLPIYATLAYSLSVVDMALILGPGTPPTVGVLVLRWFNDPDLALRFRATAGAGAQLALVAAAIALWRAGELAAARVGRRAAIAGGRGGSGALVRGVTGGALGLVLAATGGAVVALALWSLAGQWRYPDALPATWTLRTWAESLPTLARPACTTLAVGMAATLVALGLVLGCLENERRGDFRPPPRALWLIYVPLLVPQVAFLFGVQVSLVALDLDGTWVALIWSHLLFVLPYVFLTLADPFRALDQRYARTAACLGARPSRVFWRVTAPLLVRPILAAAAIGFSVSVAQYVPTLLVGAGRLATLTTDAVGLAAGGDRRIAAVAAFAQAALPLIGFALALAAPSLARRGRRGAPA